MTQNRGCFDRDDDDPAPHEYASPPCYMHEVHPAYFGSLPPACPTSDQTSDVPPEEHHTIVSRATLPCVRHFQAFGRSAAMQCDRVKRIITALIGSKSLH
ncbi:hypothetical protein AS156_15160 [Bradyrhizobium macuxiense]|uniref:Uncharacterized protein n=1 Tax=Bradyrhizobium macuxiense TaxID=1755647 RepID=A0A125Q740_9BRAD|nr:hypothetical protein AS156_15160 [Bradyrhizobium macuxiense]